MEAKHLPCASILHEYPPGTRPPKASGQSHDEDTIVTPEVKQPAHSPSPQARSSQ